MQKIQSATMWKINYFFRLPNVMPVVVVVAPKERHDDDDDDAVPRYSTYAASPLLAGLEWCPACKISSEQAVDNFYRM